jgi:hypothetical protein
LTASAPPWPATSTRRVLWHGDEPVEPYGGHNEDDPSIRFQGIDVIPPTLPDAPPGGFPQTPPLYANVITSALDGTIVTPYNHTFNVVVGRELGKGFSFEAAYVGRRGRNLLVRAMRPCRPTSRPWLRARLLHGRRPADWRRAGNRRATRRCPPTPALRANPTGRTCSRRGHGWDDGDTGHGEAFNAYAPDYISALFGADQFCDPACSKLGEFAFFSTQYDTLGIQSTIARAEYDAMQLSLRKRFSAGYQFDVKLHAGLCEGPWLAARRRRDFGNFDNGGYTGFLIDSWDPDKQYGRADFDVRHLVNLNWIAEVPVGAASGLAPTCPACSTPCWATGRRPASSAGAVASRSASTTAGSAGPRTGTCRQRGAGGPEQVARDRDDAQRGQRLSEPVCRRRPGAVDVPAREAG